jgi:glycosyltransferase involved in cell wall biosynthesis
MEFLYFGNDWFAENRTSSHHIARRLGAQFPLLYVEVPGLRAPKANARDARKLLRKLGMAFQPPQQVGPHLWRMTLPQIPAQRFGFVRALNKAFSRTMLRRAIRRLGFRDYITWFHVPHPGFLAGQLGEKLTVFYCIDDYSRLPDVDTASVRAMDDQLTSASDIVFACNQALADARRPLNPNVHVSPHGVDTEVFALASAPETTIPPELNDLPRPIIGSWGLIDPRVDLGIVEHIARVRPHWTILLIGRAATDVAALKALPNVIFAGVKPYTELPGWAKAIDVCILPYVQTPLVLASSPLKLREYLASGKPLVATPLPEALLLGEAVLTASTPDDFVAAIEQALATNSPELVALRQRSVAGNTWDAVVEDVLQKIEAALNSR